jgi:hypothetical protein
VEVQRAQLEAQQRQIALLSAQAAKLDQLGDLLGSLQTKAVTLQPPVVTFPSGAPDPDRAPALFIPTIQSVEVGESQIKVEETAGQGVADTVKALKSKRKG